MVESNGLNQNKHKRIYIGFGYFCFIDVIKIKRRFLQIQHKPTNVYSSYPFVGDDKLKI